MNSSALKISSSNNPQEQEADQTADHIMRMPESPFVQRKCATCEHEEEKVSRKTVPFIQKQGNGVEGGTASEPLSNQINSSRGGGSRMSENTLSFMESRFNTDFSGVKVHTDSNAIQMSRELNAQAFTVGSDIYFNEGKYNPESDSGKHLLAHELTHTVQQSGGIDRKIQRTIDEAALPQTPTTSIMADSNYIDNNISSITFYEAQQALIHYSDGKELLIGLVPDWVTAPIEGIDYKTPKSTHIQISPTTPQKGGLDFIPRGQLIKAPAKATFQDFVENTKQHSSFHVESKSGKIVPTIINSITAPILCSTLRTAEQEYIAQFDAMAQGMIKVLKKMELIIILGSLLPSGGMSAAGGGARAGAGRAAARGGAAAAATGMAGRATSKLVQFFARLIGNSTLVENIIVEGVEFGSVRAATESQGVLRITRFSIENTLRATAEGKGLGRIMTSAYEQAAIQAARQAGMTTVKLSVETIVNASWRAYMESIGYQIELIETTAGFSKVWTKVIGL
jgi:Domain of unknown function (DUF4157)